MQLSGLDGFTSFNLPLKQQIKDIDSDPGGRTSGLEKWRRIVRDTVGKGVLSSHLNKAAVDSQNENSEPVRLDMLAFAPCTAGTTWPHVSVRRSARDECEHVHAGAPRAYLGPLLRGQGRGGRAGLLRLIRLPGVAAITVITT